LSGFAHPSPAYRRFCILAAISVLIVNLTFMTGTAFADNRNAMARAADQLTGMQLPSGLFEYEYNFLTGEETDKANVTNPNMVRQADAAFALAGYYALAPSPELRESLLATLNEFARLSLPIGRGPVQDIVQKLRVLSLPYGRRTLQRFMNWSDLLYTRGGDGRVISPDGAYESAWVGSTALALLAEIRYSKASGDTQFAKHRDAWLRGLLSLRIPGRGFRAAPHHISEMEFFNGESWFALATYIDFDPNNAAVAGALETLDDHLMQRYADPWNILFYSWGMMAAERRYATTRDEKFLSFIVFQTKAYLEHLKPAPDGKQRVNCAGLEGLVSARRVLGAHVIKFPNLVKRLNDLINTELPKNLSRQVRPGQNRIDLGGGAYLSSSRLSGYAGAFLESIANPVTRIDLTGHCLSAMMMLESMPADD
jgi:hypothetical protein